VIPVLKTAGQFAIAAPGVRNAARHRLTRTKPISEADMPAGSRTFFVALGAFSLATASLQAAAASSTCEVRSGATVPKVVELYTSEGCSSCPPADRWLSQVAGERADVIPMAFHVQYWDYLGWKDRFADIAYTHRQADLQRTSGARGSYTPQVIVDGRDWRQWPTLPAADQTSAVTIVLKREADAVSAQITPGTGAPAKLAGWWVALESGHSNAVKAGENDGATLRHDHVVRAYEAVPEWNAAARQLTFRSPSAGEGGRARSVALVITDAASGKPVQAVRLGC
jgi:hypothetical protein